MSELCSDVCCCKAVASEFCAVMVTEVLVRTCSGQAENVVLDAVRLLQGPCLQVLCDFGAADAIGICPLASGGFD